MENRFLIQRKTSRFIQLVGYLKRTQHLKKPLIICSIYIALSSLYFFNVYPIYNEYLTQYNKWYLGALADSPIVYITSSGHKYHKSAHYSNRTTPIKMLIAYNEGYENCKVCKPGYYEPSREPVPPSGVVMQWKWILLFTSAIYLSLIGLCLTGHNTKYI